MARKYRIGEFAQLGAIPIKTLRYYDQLALLEPREVDARTRYRYYDAAQLRDLDAIRVLQALGASLDDIRRVLSRADAGRGRRNLLIKLRANALRTLAATRRSLDWIEHELDDVAHGLPESSVVLKRRGEVRIASIRAQLASYADVTPMERDLSHAVHPALAGKLRGVLWHRCEASGAIEAEPFMEVRGQASRSAGFELRRLPGAHVASAYCESDDGAATRTYEAIDRWIHRHSLRLDGPKREIYVGQLLEIQFPVQPA
ncbi:MAG TPA: MerR family transcriptional regulator [Steroidobacteraceae bacterium]|nr:MerR family transcriptional regulator [Steroidobacteraceae bacterium]